MELGEEIRLISLKVGKLNFGLGTKKWNLKSFKNQQIFSRIKSLFSQVSPASHFCDYAWTGMASDPFEPIFRHVPIFLCSYVSKLSYSYVLLLLFL